MPFWPSERTRLNYSEVWCTEEFPRIITLHGSAGRVTVGQFLILLLWLFFVAAATAYCQELFFDGVLKQGAMCQSSLNYNAWFSGLPFFSTQGSESPNFVGLHIPILQQRGFLSSSIYNIGLGWTSVAQSVDRWSFWESSLALIWYSEWTAFLQMHLLIASQINPPHPPCSRMKGLCLFADICTILQSVCFPLQKKPKHLKPFIEVCNASPLLGIKTGSYTWQKYCWFIE